MTEATPYAREGQRKRTVFVVVDICQNLDLFIHREQRREKDKCSLVPSRGQESLSCLVDTVSAMASPPCGMTGSLGSMSQEPPFSCWLVLMRKLRDFPSCVDLGISTLIRHSTAVDICLWKATLTLPRSPGSTIPSLWGCHPAATGSRLPFILFFEINWGLHPSFRLVATKLVSRNLSEVLPYVYDPFLVFSVVMQNFTYLCILLDFKKYAFIWLHWILIVPHRLLDL